MSLQPLRQIERSFWRSEQGVQLYPMAFKCQFFQKLEKLTSRYSQIEAALQQPNLSYQQVQVQVAELKLLLVECAAAAAATPSDEDLKYLLDLLKLARKIVRCLLT